VLSAGEIGLETDTLRTKYGNGTLAWADLNYSVADASGLASVEWDSVLNKPSTFPPSAHTHLIADITDLTATATELNFVDGVTSAVQTQLDAKAETLPDLSDVTLTTLTTGEVLQYDGTKWVNAQATTDPNPQIFMLMGA
jgi:hypothetical protein